MPFQPGIMMPIMDRRKRYVHSSNVILRRLSSQVDVIAAPVAPSTAFRFGEHINDPLAMYLEDVFTLPANLAGIPGLAFPVGFDQNHLPIGIQLMGASFLRRIAIKNQSCLPVWLQITT